MAVISGHTYDVLGAPEAAYVTVQRRSDLSYIDRVVSDAVTGAFSVTVPGTFECVVTRYEEVPVAYFDPDAAHTSLLLPFQGAHGSTTFTDTSPNGLPVTRSFGTGTISTSIPPHSDSSSMHFPGNTRLELPANSLLNLTGQFIIETWAYFLNTSDCHILYGPGNYQIRRDSATQLSCYNGSSYAVTTSTIPTYAWVHLLWSRDASNVIRIFLNGAIQGAPSSANTGAFNFSGGQIGEGNGGWVNGYLQDFRIKKGVSVAANFTPPASFNTGGLTDGGSGGNARIYDRVVPV